ncbi:hypothetical protein ABK864_03545 [Serratia marcescens]|uniref:hypothetical protein n=1 Tax=Serratia TaxID=613 RepID=UPI00313AB405
MEFKFSVYNNMNQTNVLSVEKQIVQTVAMTNNRNSLKKFLSSSDIHRNLRSKLLSKLENALTVTMMNSFEIGFCVINENLAIAAYNDEKAVVIACDVRGAKKTWKAMGTNLNSHKARHDSKGNYVSMMTGLFVEIVEQIEFPTEQKVDNVRSEMDVLKAKIEAMEKENAALRKENSAYKKHIKGEKMSFEEEMIVVSLEVSSAPTKVKEDIDNELSELMTESEVSTISDSSTLFSLTTPDEIINKSTIVVSDQSKPKHQNFYKPYELTASTQSAVQPRLARIREQRLAA